MEKAKKVYDVVTFVYEENGPHIDTCKTFQTLGQAKRYAIDYCKKFLVSRNDFQEFKRELAWRKYKDIFGSTCYGVDTSFDSDEDYPVIVENKSSVNNTKTKSEELDGALHSIKDSFSDIEEIFNDIALNLNTFYVNTTDKKYLTIANKVKKIQNELSTLLNNNLPIRK